MFQGIKNKKPKSIKYNKNVNIFPCVSWGGCGIGESILSVSGGLQSAPCGTHVHPVLLKLWDLSLPWDIIQIKRYVVCLKRNKIRRFSSKRPRYFFVLCLPSAFTHEILGYHLCRLPLEAFSICHAHMQKKNQPWRFHPHPWNGRSLCLLQLSARLLLKRQKGEEKMQTRYFLVFRTKSCSEEDHKCLRWQRERDLISPWLFTSTNNLPFICSTVSSISCFIQAYTELSLIICREQWN